MALRDSTRRPFCLSVLPPRLAGPRPGSANSAGDATKAGSHPAFRRPSSYIGPLGAGRHRDDVGEVNEPEGLPDGAHLVPLVLDLGDGAPHVPGAEQPLLDPAELLERRAVLLVAGIQREAEDADRIGLPGPEERRRH